MVSLLTEQGSDDHPGTHERTAPRHSMLVMGVMRRPSEPDVAIKVRNLSAGGMLAEAPISFSTGEAVETDLRGIGAVSGRVAWVAGNRVGVVFDRIIDPALARTPVGSGPQPQLVKVARSMWRPGLKLK